MATTYSTNLKLALIGNGEQANVWGTTTNTNLGTLLEQAIAGVQNITLSTTNYVLSNLNGVSDEARNAVLVVTGTPGGVKQILVPNGQTKTYIVVNNTTGGFDIGLQTWSGSGLTGTGAIATIPNGASLLIYCTGSNCYSVAPYTAFTATPVTFNGWASGTTLHVTSAPSAPIAVGQTIYNPGILYTTSGFPSNTTITAFGTGTGGTGTYTISNSSTVGTVDYPQPIVALNTLTQIATVDYAQNKTESVYLQGAPTADTATAAAFEGQMKDNVLIVTKIYITGNPIGLGQYINGVNVYEYGTYVSAFGTGTTGNASFTGYISGTTLTVVGSVTGTITTNQYLSGAGITVGTKIVSGSGTTWTVDTSQTVGSASNLVSVSTIGPGSGDIGWYTLANGNQSLTGQVVQRTPMISFLSPLQLSNTLFVSNISYLLGTLGTQSDTAVNILGGVIKNVAISGLNSPLAIADGGTGASSLTANNVLLGNGTGAVQTVAPGTSGYVLTSNGSTWTSAPVVSGSLGSSGYQKFPGGLTIAWGSITTSNPGGGNNNFYVISGSTTLPVTFTNVYQANLGFSSSNVFYGASIGVSSLTTTTLSVSGSSPYGNGLPTVTYLIIGTS